mmetsp:Transcript_50267/g.92887  ORF Transcript_50267/g.92887 Transcript_50267/m.92887 type:complete len:224 (-) Transcript_50267:579-1250(-)
MVVFKKPRRNSALMSSGSCPMITSRLPLRSPPATSSVPSSTCPPTPCTTVLAACPGTRSNPFMRTMWSPCLVITSFSHSLKASMSTMLSPTSKPRLPNPSCTCACAKLGLFRLDDEAAGWKPLLAGCSGLRKCSSNAKALSKEKDFVLRTWSKFTFPCRHGTTLTAGFTSRILFLTASLSALLTMSHLLSRQMSLIDNCSKSSFEEASLAVPSSDARLAANWS